MILVVSQVYTRIASFITYQLVMRTLKQQLHVPYKIVSAGTGNEVIPDSIMAVDGNYKCFKSLFLHIGWMCGTPFHTYDKAANQDMYDFIMLWPNVWKRGSVPKYLDTCHLCCCAIEYIARSINAHVLYCRERERI